MRIVHQITDVYPSYIVLLAMRGRHSIDDARIRVLDAQLLGEFGRQRIVVRNKNEILSCYLVSHPYTFAQHSRQLRMCIRSENICTDGMELFECLAGRGLGRSFVSFGMTTESGVSPGVTPESLTPKQDHNLSGGRIR